MHPTRIAELLTPYLRPFNSGVPSSPCHSEHARSAGEESAVLSPTQLGSISTYIDLLLRWNARINLTAIRSEEEIVTRHFGESLFAARHLFPKIYPVASPVPSVPPVLEDFDSANDQRPTANDTPPEAQSPKPGARAADLGSGPGFPGIPIKLWAPEIHMTLIESNHKKAAFLREVIRSLTLTCIDVKIDRAESISEAYDLVTLRAVERFTAMLPVVTRLLSPTGRIALLIARSQLDHACSTLPNFSWNSPLPVPNSQSRILLIGRPS
jgi:16S rRNA (guanine527-N7)-methyltransferase